MKGALNAPFSIYSHRCSALFYLWKTVGGVERGEHNVAVVNLEKIANALGVGIKDFFGKR